MDTDSFADRSRHRVAYRLHFDDLGNPLDQPGERAGRQQGNWIGLHSEGDALRVRAGESLLVRTVQSKHWDATHEESGSASFAVTWYPSASSAKTSDA